VTYRQSTGELFENGGHLIATCYSGQGAGKNQPGWQSVAFTGPLPQGRYFIGPLATRPHYGPSMMLTPDATTRMRGRAGFLIHLDNPAHVGDSSDGCIIAPSLDVLQAIVTTGDTSLTIVE
jgi:hypothetical protein